MALCGVEVLLYFDSECIVLVSVFEDDDAAVFDDFADAFCLVCGDVLDAGRPVDFDFGMCARVIEFINYLLFVWFNEIK